MRKAAIILVDHGSRLPAAAAALAEVANMASEILGLEVHTAHLEIGSPTLEQAIEELADKRPAGIIICPYFLAEGKHSKQIAAIAAAAAARHKGISILVTKSLGPEKLLAYVIVSRIGSSLMDAEGAAR